MNIKNFVSIVASSVGLFAGPLMGASVAKHTVIVVEQTHGSVSFYDSERWSRLGHVRVGKNPHEIAIAADQRKAYVTNFGIQDYDETIGTPGSTVSEIDIQSMVETRLFSTKPDLAPHGVKQRPNHERELFVNTEKPARMLVFDTTTGLVARRFNIDAKTHNFVFSADGSILWLMAGPNGVFAVDPKDGHVLAHHAVRSPARGLVLTADNTKLIVSGKDQIEVLDPLTLKTTALFAEFNVGQILYAAPSPDGRYIVAPAVWDSTILVLDLKTGAVIKRIASGLDPVAVTFSPDSAFAYVSNARDHGLTKINLTTLLAERVETLEGPNGLACIRTPRFVSRGTTLRFATILPLSGRDATFGREMMLGYELWKNDVNAKGGILNDGRASLVAIEYLDNASDSSQTETLGRAAVTGGARFLLGSYGTPDNAAVARVAASEQVPLLTSAGAAKSLYQQGNSFLFGIMTPASKYLIGSIDIALSSSPRPVRAAIVTSDAPAPLEDARNAASYARSHGIGTVALSPVELEKSHLTLDATGALVYKQGSADFSEIIAALNAAHADLFVMAGDLWDSMTAVRTAKKIRFAPFGFAFSVGPSVPLFATAMGLGVDANYMIGPTQWSPEAKLGGPDRYGTASGFAEGFWTAYNTRASYLSAGAYASGLTYEDAMRRAKILNSTTIQAALKTTDFESFYGRIRFNAQGLNETKPMYTVQIETSNQQTRERLLSPATERTRKPVWPFPGWRL